MKIALAQIEERANENLPLKEKKEYRRFVGMGVLCSL